MRAVGEVPRCPFGICRWDKLTSRRLGGRARSQLQSEPPHLLFLISASSSSDGLRESADSTTISINNPEAELLGRTGLGSAAG